MTGILVVITVIALLAGLGVVLAGLALMVVLALVALGRGSSPLALHLGLRYLRRRRAAWLALAAVTLTVAVPIAVMGVMQGWVDVMRDQVRAAESDLTVTSIYVDQYGLPVDRFEDALTAIEGVAAVAPYIDGGAVMTPLVSRGERYGRADSRRNVFTKIQGLDWQRDVALGRLDGSMLHVSPTLDLNRPNLPPERRGTGFLTPAWRSWLALKGADMIAPLAMSLHAPQDQPRSGIILGREMVFINHGLHGPLAPGTTVSMIIPDGAGGTVGKVLCEVSDTIGTGVYEIDRWSAYLPLPQAQRLADMDGTHPASGGQREISGYRVRLRPGADPATVQRAIGEHLGLHARHWTETRGNLVKNLEVQRNILGFVMICVQLICVFIVYAVFSTLVAEKRHDIGVLLGLGASRHEVVAAFLQTALGICLIGGLGGWAIGWGLLALLNPISDTLGIPLFPQDVMYTPNAPISFQAGIPALYVAGISAVSLAASYLPAWRAGRIDPIDTIRENG